MKRTKKPKVALETQARPWPADAITRWPTDKVKPYPRNARSHSKDQVALIAASIQKFGFTAPLLVDENGVLIYGHGRLAAAKSLGLQEVPVCVAEGWTESEKAAYRIADNQIGLRSDWDMPLLQAEVRELSISEFPLELTGFNDTQLQWMRDGELGSDSPVDEWLGMPEYKMEDKRAYRSIIVHLKDQEAVEKFEAAINLKLSPKARFLWYPEIEVEHSHDKIWVNDDEQA